MKRIPISLPFFWIVTKDVLKSISVGGFVGLTAVLTVGIITKETKKTLMYRGFIGFISAGFTAGIFWGISEGFSDSLAIGIATGFVIGFAANIAIGFYLKKMFDVNPLIFIGIGGGCGLWLSESIEKGFFIGALTVFGFLFTYFRIYNIFPHLIQYYRAKISVEKSIEFFINSPIHWDEVTIIPLPFLSKFLSLLIYTDANKSSSEIEFILSERPAQRKGALKSILTISINNLSKFDSMDQIAEVSSSNSIFFSFFEALLPTDLRNIIKNMEDITIEANSYIDASSNYNKIRSLNTLLSDVEDLKKILLTKKDPLVPKLYYIAEVWSKIIKEENKKFVGQKLDESEEIPNPYIFGNPIKPDDSSRLFVGRLDIIELIKSNISVSYQRPAIFLYGRRRVGKSSVLLNLPKLIGKDYISVYIDCQDVKYRENNVSFCYNVLKSMSNSINDRGIYSEYPPIELLNNSCFTILSEWFDNIEILLEKEDKLLLITFDEYEKIEESIINCHISIEILDQLRNIIQHRSNFVVLVAGSNELKKLKINWSDYLIGTKMIKLGNLSENDAKILIANPTDDFCLSFEGGKNGKAINRILHSAAKI